MGRLSAAQPTAATGYESNAIAASVIGGASMLGGVGTVWGAIVGAFIMSILTNGFTLLHVNTFFQQSAIGFILIMAVYLDIAAQQRLAVQTPAPCPEKRENFQIRAFIIRK